jgi:hypothetical protein
MFASYPITSTPEVQFLRVGDKVHRWTILDGLVIHPLPDCKRADRKSFFFRCRCECGTVRDVPVRALFSGGCQSCGCLQRERTGDASRRHGLSKRRIYRIFKGMQDRCRNPNTEHYKNYGGRGIRVVDEWSRFETFYEWAMANGYADDLTIERKDVNGPYSPTNCTWIPGSEQIHNRRKTVWVEAFGERKTASNWCKDSRSQATLNALHSRLRQGWEPELAITTPTSSVHRLSLEEAKAVKVDIEAGHSDMVVARKHNIGKTTARYIRVGKLWPEA